MKCPYCAKEMLRGYLNNGRQPIHWIPEGKKPAALAFSMAKDGVCLCNTYAMTRGYSAEAYYCDACRLVMAKTER